MASLFSICEQAWQQVHPMPDDETTTPIEFFIEAGILEYCYQVQLMYWRNKREDGDAEIPSHLLREIQLPVKNNEVDLCELKVFRSFSSDVWLANVGEIGCECQYVRYNVNAAKLLCDADSRGHEYRTYIPLGNKIKFPEGTHANPITIIYAGMGEGVDSDIEVDEVIGNIVRDKLVEKYQPARVGVIDTTNNSTPVV